MIMETSFSKHPILDLGPWEKGLLLLNNELCCNEKFLVVIHN